MSDPAIRRSHEGGRGPVTIGIVARPRQTRLPVAATVVRIGPLVFRTSSAVTHVAATFRRLRRTSWRKHFAGTTDDAAARPVGAAPKHADPLVDRGQPPSGLASPRSRITVSHCTIVVHPHGRFMQPAKVRGAAPSYTFDIQGTGGRKAVRRADLRRTASRIPLPAIRSLRAIAARGCATAELPNPTSLD